MSETTVPVQLYLHVVLRFVVKQIIQACNICGELLRVLGLKFIYYEIQND